MQKLGKTDLVVSPVCLGCDVGGTAVPEDEFFHILDKYTDEGGNLVDTAAVYCRWIPPFVNSSEITLGKWIRNNPGKRLVIATKGGHYDLATHQKRITREDIKADMETSLKTLGVDHIDMYYLHRDDLELPIGEIVEMMNDFVKTGNISFFAASNYKADRLFEADKYAKEHNLMSFAAVSNQYSLATPNPGVNVNMDPTIVIDSEEDIVYHEQSGTPLLPYQSTARGYFAKKAISKTTPELEKIFGGEANDKIYERLSEKSRETGLSMQTLSITELARSRNFQIVPVTSVNSLKRLDDVIEALHYLEN